jgi:predicted nuclease of predicted toxin-antitoxin system
VVHQRDEGLQRLADVEVLAKARAEARTVVTHDLDFGDLLAAGGANAPSVVIVRTTIETPAW